MKKYVIFFIAILCSMVFSQENDKNKIFSISNFSLFSGINFDKISNVHGAFYFEGGTNFTKSLYGNLSFGYEIIFNKGKK